MCTEPRAALGTKLKSSQKTATSKTPARGPHTSGARKFDAETGAVAGGSDAVMERWQIRISGATSQDRSIVKRMTQVEKC